MDETEEDRLAREESEEMHRQNDPHYFSDDDFRRRTDDDAGFDEGEWYVANCVVCGARLTVANDPDLCEECMNEIIPVAMTLENGKAFP